MPEVVTYIRPEQKLSKLCLAIAKHRELFSVELEDFADTETSLSFKHTERISGKKVFLVWEFSYNQQINSQLFDLLFTLCFLKRVGAININVFMPSLPYSRQDNAKHGQGEDVVNLIKLSGAMKVISVEQHVGGGLDVVEIKLAEFWASHIKKMFSENVILASPDEGGIERVKEVASILGFDSVYIEKTRTGVDESKALGLHGDVANKTVVLIDDILDTGCTAINACEMLIKNGAKEVIGCFVHGVLSRQARQRLEESSFRKVFITNTILSAVEAESEKIRILDISDFCVGQLSNFLE